MKGIPMNTSAGLWALPEPIRGGMERWIAHGIRPGSFLTAVLCNDLASAVFTADEVNAQLLAIYVRFLQDHAPRGCWGSPENYESWAAHNGAEGLAHGVT